SGSSDHPPWAAPSPQQAAAEARSHSTQHRSAHDVVAQQPTFNLRDTATAQTTLCYPRVCIQSLARRRAPPLLDRDPHQLPVPQVERVEEPALHGEAVELGAADAGDHLVLPVLADAHDAAIVAPLG